MAKAKTQYVCQECGGTSIRWQGQCPHCQTWNSMVEFKETPVTSSSNRFTHLAAQGTGSIIQNLSEVATSEITRFSTGISEFDRVLGGGLVPGGVVLLGGDPGIGKSTLLIQAIANLSSNQNVLYVSGEESAEQVAMRAHRLELPTERISLLPEIQLEKILSSVDSFKPSVLVIDSIQTIFSAELNSAPGSVSQVRECAAQLTRVAKQAGIAMVLIGHVTKDGTLAGPRVLEHIVDCVLYFEGESDSTHRLIRAFKNRFGAVNELGVFAMTDRGLRGIANPSAIFLSQHSFDVTGSCVMVTQEGTRPLLVEIQSLVNNAHIPNPRRLTIGLDSNRIAMLLAILSRHANIPTYDQDVFVNVVGGVRIKETASDLAVVLAIISSMRNKPLPVGLVAFGEVGLGGEIRPSPRGQERLKEAAKLGFKMALVPKHNEPKKEIKGIKVYPMSRLSEVLEFIR